MGASRLQRSGWAIEAAVQGIVGLDPRGAIVRWNSGARRIFGYRSAEALGRPLTALFPAVARKLRALLADTRPNHPGYAEASVRRGDGKAADVAFTAVRTADPDGVLLVIRDVSARKEAERRLHETVSMLESARGAGEAARRALRDHAELDRRAWRRLFFVVEAALRLFETLDHRGALSGLCRWLVPRAVDRCVIHLRDPGGGLLRTSGGRPEPASLPRIGAVPRVLSTGEYELWTDPSDEDLDRILQDADEPSVPVSAVLVLPFPARAGPAGTLTLVQAESGRRFGGPEVEIFQAVARLAGMAIDNGSMHAESVRLNLDLEARVERRTAELREALRDVETYASAVAHDLRAPLRSLRSFSEMLLEDCGDRLDARGKDYAGRIRSAAARLEALVVDLLAYSRISRRDLVLGPVGLREVVDDVLHGLEEELSQAGAQVHVGALPGPVRGDRTALGQVLRNLVSNAIRFVAAGVSPRIRIHAERRGPRVRLWVADNGTGIPAQDRQRIFRPFERGAAAGATAGTGLGLSIVSRGVERMGGWVGVESAPGHGSRFWVELSAA